MVITTAIVAAGADFALDKAKDALFDWVRDKAIGRWSEHRARQFFDAFIDEVRKEDDVLTTSAELNDMLQSIANNDEQTSAIFDAYRRVALSASKDIGPMVIGLLTARIVLEGRAADEIEEMVFEGAEVLNDRDFTSLLAWMQSFVHDDSSYGSELAQQRAAGMPLTSIPVLVKGGYQPPVTITQTGRAPTISYQPRVPMINDESPLNLFNEIGPFALKLRNIGLLEESSSPRGHPRNPDGTLYYVRVSPACEQLYDLVVRASEAAAIKRGPGQDQ
ncbi:hypothetical protein M0D69_11195 [Caballeronia sp. SEWSISQ10-4 2]|uniref:hypothetical protein n=1 Tax=Caballeronia sp. SEWSISQ10-4 2 TaxID=2937438 RepID=UPI00264D11FD|nr:hypothetical protein [Caballeronia sp. SEWSISQ10-4 2]MDN7178577.1 hypothetical protein [Caballeronia sp. SEWSISQ10-4 2]